MADKQELPNIEMSQEEYKNLQAQISSITQQSSVAQAIAVKEKNRSEELSNLVNRMQADFDNYRRRMNDSIKKMKEEGICATVEKILPIIDVTKEAIKMITDEKVAEGVKMIYRQMNDMLTSLGIVEIPALGEQFDPNVHNAVMQVKVKDAANNNVIVEVFNKGYKLNDRIIRHSKVSVGTL